MPETISKVLITLFLAFSIGVVSTFAGSGAVGLLDGLGIAAKFYNCRGLAVDDYGNLFVADSNNNAIRKVTPAGMLLAVFDVTKLNQWDVCQAL